MKQRKLYALFFFIILVCNSCSKEPTISVEFEGKWFRSYRNKVTAGKNKPPIERGETHITFSFNNRGEFINNRTVLGLYEGTSITDTTAIIIESGIFTSENDKIEIILDDHKWWDSYYEDMEGFETDYVIPNKYKDITYQITGNVLKLEYFIETDVISGEQETPGFDKFEKEFIKL